MELLLWQISFAIAIFTVVIVCSLIPSLLVSGRHAAHRSSTETADVIAVTAHFWKRLFGWCDCLTGGVFLAICFLSLLPNVEDQAKSVLHYLHLEHSFEFPVAECAILLGFFVVMVVDQTGKHWEASRVRTRRVIEMDSLGVLDRGGDGEEEDDEDDATADRRTLLMASDDTTTMANGNDGRLDDGLRITMMDDFEVGSPTTDVSPLSCSASTRLMRSGSASSSRGPRSIDLMEKCLTKNNYGSSFLFLLFALSIHALFEGIVLGIQTDVPSAIHLFTAIAVHESIVSATLGFNVAKVTRHSTWTAVRYITLYAVCIPFGIGLGLAIGRTPGALGHGISGAMQALAAGIFLHITFMHLLPNQFGHGQRDGLVKTLFLFVGFLMMTILNLAVGFVH